MADENDVPGAPGPGVRRLRDLPVPWRRLLSGVLVLAALLPLLQAGRALADGWQPTGDVALIVLRARHVVSDPPLLGQPDSADSTGAVVSAHVGPIETYVLAPFVTLFGLRVGAALGIAVLQAAALVASLWLAFRRGGPLLVALLASAWGATVLALGVGILHNPLNSLVPTLAIVPLAIASWSLCVDDRAALPIFAASAAVVLQPHLAHIPFAVGLVVVGLVGFFTSIRRPWSVADHRSGATAVVLTLVAWAPPLLQEVRGPSNLAAVFRGGDGVREPMGAVFAIRRLATTVAPVPRPPFLEPSNAVAPSQRPGAVVLAVGLLAVALAVPLGREVMARGHAHAAAFPWMAVVALVIATVVTARMPMVAVFRSDHARWIWTGGMLFWVAVVWSLWQFVPAPTVRRAVRPLTIGLLVVAGLLSLQILRSDPLTGDTDRSTMRRVGAVADATADALPSGTYLAEFAGSDSAALLSVLPAVVAAVDAPHRRVYVDRGPFTRGFGARQFRPDDTVLDGRLLVYSATPTDLPAGARLVARSDPPEDAAAWGATSYTVYLVPA